MSRWRWLTLLTVVAVVTVLILATGDVVAADDGETGRQIVAKSGGAVVRVLLVAKTTMSYKGSARTHEGKSEVTGTVIDPSGLTVISAAVTDPAAYYEKMYKGEDAPQVTSNLTDVRIRLPDGKEIPAKVVLRDRDLDLAFVRPAQKLAAPIEALDLKDSVKLDLLDQVVVISRNGKAANRSISVWVDRISSIVEKPRKFYVVDIGSSNDYGAPVFAMDGKVVGLVFYKELAGSSDDGDSGLPVVVPAEDIASVAAQAPEEAVKEPAKPPVKKPAVIKKEKVTK